MRMSKTALCPLLLQQNKVLHTFPLLLTKYLGATARGEEVGLMLVGMKFNELNNLTGTGATTNLSPEQKEELRKKCQGHKPKVHRASCYGRFYPEA